MKKLLLFLFLLTTAFLTNESRAEDAAVNPSVTADQTMDAPSVAPTSAETEMPPVETAPVEPAAVPALEPAPPVQDVTLADNLEFISGEVSEMDEAGKTVSVRLYGETEEAASDKVLKVNVDENTDITDGEQDRDLKSLTAGTEVDVEYDPTSNKATYIFVY